MSKVLLDFLYSNPIKICYHAKGNVPKKEVVELEIENDAVSVETD